ncbi:MAG: ATP-dependent DNA helicase RecG [Treponema sp.]|nr:ATP-dependent DNA helicase RecG [Treponema sp.]
MKVSEINTSVSAVNGVGPAMTKQLARLNVFTVGDLLQYYPKKYEDRTKKIPLKDFQTGGFTNKVHTIVQITGHEWFGYGNMKTLKLQIHDGTAAATLVCFNRPFMENAYPVGAIAAVTGKFEVKYGTLQCTAFEIQKLSENGALDEYKNQLPPNSRVIPIYALTEGLTQKKLSTAIENALLQYGKGIDDELDIELRLSHQFLPKQKAIQKIHKPETLEEAELARKTLAYEELFFFQKKILERTKKRGNANFSKEAVTTGEQNNCQLSIINYQFSPTQSKLLEALPFSLTEDQQKVICEMNEEIDRGFKERNDILISENPVCTKPPFTMARLLQGDVGSGKTLVALFLALRIKDHGGQCAVMAPTEILAKQHAETAAKLLGPLGISVAFMSGSLKSSGRTRVLKALKEGQIDLIIGTHALFSADVVYKDLQLAVIDEQHRFGVMQREAIIAKGRKSEKAVGPSVTSTSSVTKGSSVTGGKTYTFEPHLLMMSATPIPQTLAMTIFGDLDVSVIKTKPAGRKEITTYLVKEGNEQNAYNFVREQLKAGRQAYFVYPAIGESEDADEFILTGDGKENSRGLKTATSNFEKLSKNIFPEYKCALLHGKVGEEEQERILKEFQSGEIQILAATTVIEVGVDVPNATCIVIEGADHFGLSQLHQLRGRVGRSDLQSYCFLIYSEKITETGIERMKALRTSTDGFVLAEQDLKIRGPGEINGTLQAGALEFSVADVVRDKEMLLEARQEAIQFIIHNA